MNGRARGAGSGSSVAPWLTGTPARVCRTGGDSPHVRRRRRRDRARRRGCRHQHAEHRLGVALRIRGREMAREQRRERFERRLQFVAVMFSEPPVLPNEDAGIARGVGSRRQREEFVDIGAQRVGRIGEAAGDDLDAHPAVVFEQRDQQLVLAVEAPVERLERQPGPCAHLGHGECGAPGFVGELTGRGDEPFAAGGRSWRRPGGRMSFSAS